MGFRQLFNWLRPPMRPLERRLLDLLQERLSGPARQLLAAQIAQVNLVQRHASDKEVNFYRMRGGRPSFDEAIRLPLRGEVRLASVRFRPSGEDEPLKADFWLVDGFLFSITFTRGPKGLGPTVIVDDFRVLVDPMRPSVGQPSASLDPAVVSGWLREWFETEQPSQVRRPLPAEQRDDILREIQTRLPIDYLEAMAQTNGFRLGPMAVYGLTELRELVLPSDNYWTLAEFEDDGVLVVRRQGRDGALFFVSFDGEHAEPMGMSFRSAAERRLTNQSLV